MRDKDVRAAVRQMLLREYARDADTRIVEEMGIWSGSVRIDLAVINGLLCGYELKSDRDTLERLPMQADLYSRVFDRLTLVVGSRHAEKAVAHVPEWWGIIVATEAESGVGLQMCREALPNPAPDAYLVAQLLWKDEAIAVLEAFDLARGWRSKRIKAIHQRLAGELPFAELGERVRSALKRRAGWLGDLCACELDVPAHA